MKVEISNIELESVVREEIKKLADVFFRAHIREIICMECEHYVKMLVNKTIEASNNGLRIQVNKWVAYDVEELLETKLSDVLESKVLKLVDELEDD